MKAMLLGIDLNAVHRATSVKDVREHLTWTMLDLSEDVLMGTDGCIMAVAPVTIPDEDRWMNSTTVSFRLLGNVPKSRYKEAYVLDFESRTATLRDKPDFKPMVLLLAEREDIQSPLASLWKRADVHRSSGFEPCCNPDSLVCFDPSILAKVCPRPVRMQQKDEGNNPGPIKVTPIDGSARITLMPIRS